MFRRRVAGVDGISVVPAVAVESDDGVQTPCHTSARRTLGENESANGVQSWRPSAAAAAEEATSKNATLSVVLTSTNPS